MPTTILDLCKQYATKTTEEKERAFDTHLGYSGTYEQRGDRVMHHVTVSLFPDWSSSDQVRLMELDGDQLIPNPVEL